MQSIRNSELPNSKFEGVERGFSELAITFLLLFADFASLKGGQIGLESARNVEGAEKHTARECGKPGERRLTGRAGAMLEKMRINYAGNDSFRRKCSAKRRNETITVCCLRYSLYINSC